MYEVEDDTYCYPRSTVLKNLLQLKDQAELEAFEAEITTQRASEPLPAGHLDAEHYKAIHHHLFQDVYAWAGKVRSVRISKGGNAFCFPEHIDREMTKLFGSLAKKKNLAGLDKEQFAKEAAHFLAEVNAIHPFREGNGRVQLSFLTLLADKAGHAFDLERLSPGDILTATIESFGGDEAKLTEVIGGLIP